MRYTIAAARALIADAIDFACAANHHLAGQAPEQAQQWRDALTTLADALEAERAEVAAAYDVAAAACRPRRVKMDWGKDRWTASVKNPQSAAEVAAQGARRQCYEKIRDLTPSDAQAALDKLLTEARLEGWRAGRDAAARACVLSGQDLAECDWGPEGRDMAVMLEVRIRALPEPKGDNHA